MTSKLSFFKKEKSKTKEAKKRKAGNPGKINGKPKKSKHDDEVITSESENEDIHDEELSDNASDHETANEKRYRLTKKILEEIKERLPSDEKGVTSFLKRDILEKSGKVYHNVANMYIPTKEEEIKFCRNSKLGVVTCVVVSSDNKFIFSGCKDGCITKWSLADCTKVHVIKKNLKKQESLGHADQVMSLALTKDFKFLASGSCDKMIHIWDPSSLERLHIFQGHRSDVMSLCFQVGTHMLYSASKDKSIKLWNLDEMAYVETLFGHESGVISIDCLQGERAVSCGGMDKTLGFWKVPEESLLVFPAQSDCVDCVKFLDNTHFLSASNDNSLSIWTTERKKPIVTVKNAHEFPPQWISSIAVLSQSNLAASGSSDGHVRFWEVGSNFRTLERLFTIKLDGFINSMQFSDDGQYLIAGIGQEHRLGRWFESIKSAKNAVAIIHLKKKCIT